VAQPSAPGSSTSTDPGLAKRPSVPRSILLLAVVALLLGASGLGLGLYSIERVSTDGTPASSVLYDGTVSAIRGTGTIGYYGFDNFTIPGSNTLADIGVTLQFQSGGCGNPPSEQCRFEFVQSTSNTQSIVLDGTFIVYANSSLNMAYHGNTILPSGVTELVIFNQPSSYLNGATPFAAAVTITYYGTVALSS
jgi:hypothetical protein